MLLDTTMVLFGRYGAAMFAMSRLKGEVWRVESGEWRLEAGRWTWRLETGGRRQDWAEAK